MSPPRIFGIVNVTEDSFSDGGRFLDPERAFDHALALVADGADAIDLGPASSHPDAKPVSPSEEIRRLEPLVARLQSERVPLSIDSFRTETQRWALAAGVEYLNDVRGFGDPALYPALAASDARPIVMHAVGAGGRARRQTTEPAEVYRRALAFLRERTRALVAGGVAAGRIVVDPGMGFFLGDNASSSVHVLRRLPDLKRRLGREVLVSVSRKSFLGALAGRPPGERGAASLAAELFAARRGADYVRTHDVRALRDALRVAEALESE